MSRPRGVRRMVSQPTSPSWQLRPLADRRHVDGAKSSSKSSITHRDVGIVGPYRRDEQRAHQERLRIYSGACCRPGCCGPRGHYDAARGEHASMSHTGRTPPPPRSTRRSAFGAVYDQAAPPSGWWLPSAGSSTSREQRTLYARCARARGAQRFVYRERMYRARAVVSQGARCAPEWHVGRGVRGRPPLAGQRRRWAHGGLRRTRRRPPSSGPTQLCSHARGGRATARAAAPAK